MGQAYFIWHRPLRRTFLLHIFKRHIFTSFYQFNKYLLCSGEGNS